MDFSRLAAFGLCYDIIILQEVAYFPFSRYVIGFPGAPKFSVIYPYNAASSIFKFFVNVSCLCNNQNPKDSDDYYF